MNKLLLFVLLLTSSRAFAQLQASNWFFGINAGITFSTNPPTSLSGGQINQQEGCCSISDPSGNLLFYSDGQTVWDNTHTVMPNGTGLLGGTSSTQSSIVVQDPGNSSHYYLFTAPQQSTSNPLAYSIIDMTLNGGHGDITSVKNVPLLTNSTEKLTAVFHQNGTDVWIIGHEFGNNNFDAFLLTPLGISSPGVVSSVGTIHDNGDPSNVIGYLKASPCGNKLACAVWHQDFLELFDFDNSTGVISHVVQLGSWNAASGVYGLEFSPDNSKLYASIITPALTIQYNLLAGTDPDIIASADTIGASPINFNGALQTGPDARMYLVKYGGTTLACITNPNAAGAACNYVEDYVSLGSGIGQLGLPDFFASYFCNLEVVNEIESEDWISVFPNPAEEELHIAMNRVNNKGDIVVKIFNSLGQCVYHSAMNFSGSRTEFIIPLKSWSKGVYFLNVVQDEKSAAKTFVRISD